MANKEFSAYLKEHFPHTSSFLSGLALLIVDSFVLFGSILLGFIIMNFINSPDINLHASFWYALFIPVILIVYGALGLYPGIANSPAIEVKKFFGGTISCFIFIIFCIFFADVKQLVLRDFFIKDSTNHAIAYSFMIAAAISVIMLPAAREAARHKFGKHKWWGVPCIIYSSNKSAKNLADKLLDNPYLGYHPAAIIETECKEPSLYRTIPVFNNDPEILQEIHKFNVKTAFICNYMGDISPIMNSYRYTVSVSKLQQNFTSTQQLKDIAGIIGFSSVHNLTFKRNLFAKRCIDISCILIASPILIPVMLLLSILVKLTSKGPVFYGHKRVGQNGREFKCWKFRSMCINSQEILEHILATDPVMAAEWERDRKFVNDPRITKFGKFLRKTSLDELPQLFNVLKGEMSFIGPRPVTEPELEKYGSYKDYVLTVSPGLSGMWQISGRSETSYEERIFFDTYYIQNWSVWLDIWIFIKTVYVVLAGKGAY